jgi:lysophospholipase L1-like esterase
MNNKISPLFTLLFIVSVMAVLAVMSFVFPEGGIQISDSFTLKFPTIKNILDDNNKPRYAAIPAEAFKADSVSEYALKMQEALAKKIQKEIIVKHDTLSETDSAVVVKKKKTKKEQPPVKKTDIKSQKIEFKDNDGSVLHSFLKKLETASDADNSLRIVHYGDSQIEGDRISGFIRERLQSRFGGSGCGLLPAMKVYNQACVAQNNSGNWFRYTIFGNIDKKVTHNNYGAMCAFSRFTPLDIDTSGKEPVQASTRYNAATSIYPSAKKFSRIKIYYANNGGNCEVNVHTDNHLFKTFYLDGDEPVNVETIQLNEDVDNAELIFKAANSPDIYGISLDEPTGISVDNIAMRGGSGTVFTKMNRQVLSAMLKDLNTGLIIMQFGGNVMPFMKNAKGAADYGSWFYSQLVTLKSAVPGVAIIVIGPADMSMKQDEYYVTYPLLETVRDELKKAAFKAGAGFWDMYSAMGGKNSMPSWVAARPQLAGSDYVHFTPKGARIVAELFYEALNYEYENYRFKNAEAER